MGLIAETILIQVIAILYAEFSVRQEKPVNRLMIDYVPAGTYESKQYHRFGWLMTALFCAACSMADVRYGALAAIWYWLYFDARISKKWSFLGTEAVIDRNLVAILGKRAGLYKAIFCALVITVINAFIFYDYETIVTWIKRIFIRISGALFSGGG